ncbi:MAG: leucine--tRNA ligase [Planctomycetota bacterium]|nr:MAG: leucine--tRNA ligase [Planctomycetota bacterium]
MPRYDPKRIEPKWQRYWEEHETFVVPRKPPAGPKYYVLDMFPYPSAEGLHVGHPEGYTATDIVARYKRMRGLNVLHPMGWDAFGLPAEQHAKATGTHPRITTERNIATFRRQLKMLGFSYDWSREFATTDPDYYRWTQWIFLLIFDTWFDPDYEWTAPDGTKKRGKGRPIAELPIPEEVRAQGEAAVRRYQDKHRLAYQQEALVNWCPALGTVLANEEVIDGRSERGGHPVVRIPLRQWMLRITAYAERLLEELEPLDWPESIKTLQRNWIGRSEGAEVDFFIGSGNPNTLQQEFEQFLQHRRKSGFPREPDDRVLRVYTTRPDTLFGATYMVIAPEHPLIERLTTPEQREAVERYRQIAATKSDLERTDLAKEKTGVFTGSYAINPVNGERIPIWVADYVLGGYGTGAIMAVPAHDLRDWEFAVKFGLPIRRVVQPPPDYEPTREERALARQTESGTEFPFVGEGTAIHSDGYDGLPTAEFKKKICDDLQQKGLGRAAVNYRLRDWLFSRQHFWGEPFPIWHELDENGNPTGLLRTVPEDQLPVLLPEDFEFKPHDRPEPPLAQAPESWLYTTAEDGTRLMRETNTMPQWAGSCWYYLRFIDPRNQERFVDPDLERYWMPVDLYVGGAEHAVLHLLYARFWHKVLFDRGYVSTLEPFHKLVNQGMILGDLEYTAFRRADGRWVSANAVQEAADPETGKPIRVDRDTGEPVEPVKLQADQVEKRGEHFVLKDAPDVVVEARAYKMSKSRGNVINPDDIVDQYGADALRMYEMFMGPLEASKPWSMSGVEGISRFLGRVWRMIVDERADEVRLHNAVTDEAPNEEELRILHKTIKAVTEDIEKLSFNTAISRMMEFVNAIGSRPRRPRAILEPFVLLLSPFAPHIAEELWEVLGHSQTLAYEPWPEYQEELIAESEIELPIQVNGKVRGRVRVPADADQNTILQRARAEPSVARHLEGKQVVKQIVVPGRLINFVVKG